MNGVAISTTGHAHRLPLLTSSVAWWRRCLGAKAPIIVTVDGSMGDWFCVHEALRDHDVTMVRVDSQGHISRRGVAASKNAGIEALMERGVEHLFLSDDDCWPVSPAAVELHTRLGQAHSIVGWGMSRLRYARRHAEWSWPRGVMLYVTRAAVERVGGFYEDFGIGGHEHVEWSRRIHAAGLTAAPFVSPAPYATGRALGANVYWNCEDMTKLGEVMGAGHRRKQENTTIPTHSPEEWARLDALLAEREGSTAYVDFTAEANGRTRAILSTRA